MATASTSIGTYGELRMSVTISATYATYHTVRVAAALYNGGTATAYNNNAVAISISGHDSYSGTFTFNVPAKTEVQILERFFNVSHTASTNVSYSVTVGSTGTTTFGSGGTAGPCTLTLPSLATVPVAPTMTLNDYDASSFDFSVTGNGDGGSALTNIQVGYGTNSSTPSTYVSYGVSTTWPKTISGLAKGTTYYAWVRVQNALGYSSWSNRITFKTWNVPTAPSAPTISSVTNTTAYVTFSDAANNGSAITARQIGWSTSSSSPSTTVSSDGSTTVTGLPAGTKVYFWVRTYNSVGWSAWSSSSNTTMHDVPDAPGTPVAGTLTNTTAAVSFADGATNGAAITARQLGWSTSSSAPTTTVSSDGSDTLTGLPAGTVVYIWARAYNTYGWGPWSTRISVTTHDVPSAPTKPVVSSLTQFTVYAAFSDGATNGASIDTRQLIWNTANTATGATYVTSDGSTTVTDLPAGTYIYMWARTHNTYGWSSWSSYVGFTTEAGAWVFDSNGVAKAAVPYVNVGGVWKVCTAYARSSGIWRRCG